MSCLLVSANLRETSREVKVETSKKLTSGFEEQSAANGLLTWFHIMLGIAIFVCMTLLFVFLAIILHR
ncbi:unnamed protein product [Dibothriocephalus latus]|uniref:Uncharacterized protein n=1 Tax=Dibothriocephalus latus TaxID=60516 RepID=A0A3P7MVB0_DIBLA|nr:unnamed protein product [Dibothriocephalus latus]